MYGINTVMLSCSLPYCMELADTVIDGWALCRTHVSMYWESFPGVGTASGLPCHEEGMPLWMELMAHAEERCSCYD